MNHRFMYTIRGMLVLCCMLSIQLLSAQVIRKVGYKETGKASFYPGDRNGAITASGEPYDMYAMTAAHKYIAFNCMVKVRNIDNGREILVRVNDRAYTDSRIIDLTYKAAEKLEILGTGTANVAIEIVSLTPSENQSTEVASDVDLPDSDHAIVFDEAYTMRFVEVGTYNLKGDKVIAKGYGLQIDACTDISCALNTASKFNEMLFRDIFIQTGWANGQKVYRVLLGAFENTDQAINLKEFLNCNEIGAFVKRHYQ
ncbi:septal ring lytic transglycosylase RlpA family protein [Limibacter armeniacum]|uniref:septal ring lytic transglycosylase RlpA family protein n=1 Tax=Limibacter armeniacum TaxID=466084 RepID=UPI002FE69569